MSNTVKAKQKKTIIVCVVLSVLLLAGSIFVIVDGISRMNAPYNDFGDENFAKAYAAALGYESMRDITDEDLAKVESLVYYWSIGNDSSNNYETYAYPVVMLGYKAMTDIIISDSEEKPAADSYVMVSYPVQSVEDITAFPNLRVLRTFDINEVSEMQNGCYYTQLYSMYGMGSAVTFDSVVNSAALDDLKSLNQISGLTKLEQLSLEYTGITSLEGIENFPNLTKLDIGNTSIEGDDLGALSSLNNLTDLTLISLKGEEVEFEVEEDEDSSEETSEEETSSETSEEEKKHVHSGLTDLSALSNITSLKYLNVSGNAITDLGALEGLTNLEKLVANVNAIEKIDTISNLTNLKELFICDNHITDISGLSACTNLEVFSGYTNKITDLSPLAACTKLTTIDAYDNKLTTIGDLSKLTELTTISIYDNKITDISSLSACTKLTTIDAYDNEIEKIGDLSNLDELTKITLNNNKIADLNGLNGCAKLATLEAYNNTLSGKLDLTGCPELSELNIYVEEEEEDDKEEGKEEDTAGPAPEAAKTGLEELVVKGLKKLTTINASNNKLSAVPDLTDCEKLTSVNLSKNEITDVSGAAKGKALTTLDLSGNKISDISSLETLTTLTSLNLSENEIVDITAVGKLTSLKTLNLDKNADLADLSAINNFPTTTSLELNIIGTKAAEDSEAIKALQDRYSTLKLNYVEKKDEAETK